VFYLQDTLAVCHGETISGELISMPLEHRKTMLQLCALAVLCSYNHSDCGSQPPTEDQAVYETCEAVLQCRCCSHAVPLKRAERKPSAAITSCWL